MCRMPSSHDPCPMCRWATVINRTDAGRRSVVGKIMSAISSSGVFILFLNIVVAVFAVVGMQFFGGHFHWPDGTSSRVNFDNFYQVHSADQIKHRQHMTLASDSSPCGETRHCAELAEATSICGLTAHS